MHKSYALEGFRTSLGNVSRGARAVLSSRSWIAEGRGGHEWDSPLYAEEIRSYADEVRTMLAGAEYEQNRAITVCRSSPSNTAAVLVGEIRRMNALRSPLLQATQEAGVRDLSDDAEIRRAASIINDALTGYIDQIDAIVKDRSSCPETEEEIRRAAEELAILRSDHDLLVQRVEALRAKEEEEARKAEEARLRAQKKAEVTKPKAPEARPAPADRAAAEAHDRLAKPLQAPVAAMLGFAMLLLGGFSRFGVWRQVVWAVLALIFVQFLGTAAESQVAQDASRWPLIYLPPVVGALICAAVLWLAARPRRLRRGASQTSGAAP